MSSLAVARGTCGMTVNKLETGMSKTDVTGRMTRLLISACVVPAGLGLSILHAQAGGMPGVFRNESACGDTTGGSMGGSASRSSCDCVHCREANSSASPLRRFFSSHKAKWSEPTPSHSWKYYHPCPPYFQPTFGIHQTSWNALQEDACQVLPSTIPSDSDYYLPYAPEMSPPPPPAIPPTTATPVARMAATPKNPVTRA